jgi:hypothetical protein
MSEEEKQQSPNQDGTFDDIRKEGYFPSTKEGCPRCRCQEYIPIKENGKDKHLCPSCKLVY